MDDPRTSGPDLPLRQVGAYQLLRIVGAGRAGTVFLARRAGIERNFALKLLPPGLSAEEEGRVLREARVASRLSHPGFARVLEVDRHEDRLYVVMEHVPGPTLRERVEKGGPVPSAEAAELVAQLADALDAAHRAGVVHRDVCAKNVVLDDRTGQPRLVDFGLASEADPAQQLTRAGQALGSPEAAAPEQLRGEPVDARADVYGLGVLLYELLAGAPPFQGALPDVVRRVLSERAADRPPPPSQVVPDVDPGVEAVCLRAMAPRREERFESAAALAAALRAPRGGAPSRARAAPGARGWWHGRAAAGLAGALVALAAGAVSPFVIAARREAEAQARALERARAALARAEAEAAAAEADLAALERARDELERRRTSLDRAEADALMSRRRDYRRTGRTALRWAEPDGRGVRLVDALAATLSVHELAAATRAELLICLGRPDEALEAARRAGDAFLELRCLLRLDRRDELRDRLAQLRRAAPDDPAGRFARFMSGDTTVLRDVEPDAPVPLLLGVSDWYTREGLERSDPRLLEEAERYADAAVRREPTSVDALYARSSAAYHRWLLTKDPALVPRYLRDLYRARTLSLRALFWTYAGKTYSMIERPALAVPELKAAVVVADRTRDVASAAQARAWLGVAMLLAGDPDAALRLWIDAMRVAPDLAGTYDFLPWVRRLPREHRARLLEATPRARQADVERSLGQ